MTQGTLAAISNCPSENWDFWTSSARLCLVSYRAHRIEYGKDHPITKLDKLGFRSNMKHRRSQTYLDT